MHPLAELSTVNSALGEPIAVPDLGVEIAPQNITVPPKGPDHLPAKYPDISDLYLDLTPQPDDRGEKYLRYNYEDGAICELYYDYEGNIRTLTLTEHTRCTVFASDQSVEKYEIYQFDDSGRKIGTFWYSGDGSLVNYAVHQNGGNAIYSSDGTLRSGYRSIPLSEGGELYVDYNPEGGYRIIEHDNEHNEKRVWTYHANGTIDTYRAFDPVLHANIITHYTEQNGQMFQRDVTEYDEAGKKIRYIRYGENYRLNTIMINTDVGAIHTFYNADGTLLAINEYRPQGRPWRMEDYANGILVSIEQRNEDGTATKAYYNPNGTLKEVIQLYQ
ncbi:MAG: hypothetical protein IJD13_09780 [Oscillospiraceae bacterium]|nr:hypothetical protein [Oscillospiraceae bacterium]